MVRMRTIYPPRGERWRFPEPLVCEIEERFGDCLDTDHSAGRGNGGGIREELAARELGRPPFGTVRARVWCSWRRRRAQISATIAQHPTGRRPCTRSVLFCSVSQ